MLSAPLAFLRGAVAGAPIATLAVTLIAGTLGSGLAVANVKDFWFAHVSTPQIQQAQRAADTKEFEALADEAKKKRELEVFHFIEQATNSFYLERAEDEAWQQAQLDQLNQEIADYEKAAPPDSGRRIDQRTLDFLLGTGRVYAQPVQAGRR